MSEKELIDAYLAAVEAHKAHPPGLRRGRDGIYRCPACEPVGVWAQVLSWGRAMRRAWAHVTEVHQ